MKRNISVLLAALLVLSIAGQAAAFFEDLKLIRTMYDTTTTTERGSDIGSYAFSTTGAYGSNLNVGDKVLASTFSALGNVRVAYYAANDNDILTADYWATGYGSGVTGTFVTDGDGLRMGARKGSLLLGAFANPGNGVPGYYAGLGGSTVTANKGNTFSYWNVMDKGNEATAGSLNQNLASGAFFEVNVSLADLLTVGYVDQILYYFDYDDSQTVKNGIEVATIRTYLENGQIGTIINPTAAAVPVPAAVWLLGTGLIGLVGIRRRKN